MTNTTDKRVRTCVGCAKRSDKVSLYRIVRSSEGVVSFDASGRKAGRGAYVCSTDCLARALKNNKIARALRCSIDTETAGQITAELEEALRGAEAR